MGTSAVSGICGQDHIEKPSITAAKPRVMKMRRYFDCMARFSDSGACDHYNSVAWVDRHLSVCRAIAKLPKSITLPSSPTEQCASLWRDRKQIKFARFATSR